MTFLLNEHDEENGLAVRPIQSVEADHPWLRLLYAFTIVATIVGSMLLTGCGGGDPEDADGGSSTTQPLNCAAHPEVCK